MVHNNFQWIMDLVFCGVKGVWSWSESLLVWWQKGFETIWVILQIKNLLKIIQLLFLNN